MTPAFTSRAIKTTFLLFWINVKMAFILCKTPHLKKTQKYERGLKSNKYIFQYLNYYFPKIPPKDIIQNFFNPKGHGGK